MDEPVVWWKRIVVYVAAYAVGFSAAFFAWRDFYGTGVVRVEQLWSLGIAGVMFLSPVIRYIRWGDLEAHLDEAKRAAKEARVYYSLLAAVAMPILTGYYKATGPADLIGVARWLLRCARGQGASLDDLCRWTDEQSDDKEGNQRYCKEVLHFLEAEELIEAHTHPDGQTYRVPAPMREAVKTALAHYA